MREVYTLGTCSRAELSVRSRSISRDWRSTSTSSLSLLAFKLLTCPLSLCTTQKIHFCALTYVATRQKFYLECNVAVSRVSMQNDLSQGLGPMFVAARQV